jgi:hypothetical protein
MRNLNSYILPFILLFCLLVLGCKEQHSDQIKHQKAHFEEWKSSKNININFEFSLGSDDFDEEEYMFGTISDIEIDRMGNIYILDPQNYRIQKYSPAGLFLQTIGGTKGEAPGEFLRPKSIALDDLNNLFVADHYKLSISIFNEKGEHVRTIKTKHQVGDFIVTSSDEIIYSTFFYYGDYEVFKLNLLNNSTDPFGCKSKRTSKDVAMAGECGYFAKNEDNFIFYSYYYPYDILKLTVKGEVMLSFSRDVDFYIKPYLDENRVVIAPTGTTDLCTLPGGLLIHAIKHADLKEKKFYSYLDFFDGEGRWLANIPSTEFDLNWIRNIASDSDGNLYLDYTDPFPHIRKFSLTFSNE